MQPGTGASISPGMKDHLSPEERSAHMRLIRGRNTQPEVRVRQLLHAMGYRFRLHRRDLPGSPDIVLPKHRIVIFVHGCFWHQHKGRSEEHTSELQSLMRISYAVFCLKKKKNIQQK